MEFCDFLKAPLPLRSSAAHLLEGEGKIHYIADLKCKFGYGNWC